MMGNDVSTRTFTNAILGAGARPAVVVQVAVGGIVVMLLIIIIYIYIHIYIYIYVHPNMGVAVSGLHCPLLSAGPPCFQLQLAGKERFGSGAVGLRARDPGLEFRA